MAKIDPPQEDTASVKSERRKQTMTKEELQSPVELKEQNVIMKAFQKKKTTKQAFRDLPERTSGDGSLENV